jgi:hypothetical protein
VAAGIGCGQERSLAAWGIGWTGYAGPCSALLSVERTPDGCGPILKHMNVVKRGQEILVTKELLDGADVRSVLQEVGREGMAKGVAGGVFGDLCPRHCQPNGLLENGRIAVVAPLLTCGPVSPPPSLGEDPLPPPL